MWTGWANDLRQRGQVSALLISRQAAPQERGRRLRGDRRHAFRHEVKATTKGGTIE
jgi:hypothetical protein